MAASITVTGISDGNQNLCRCRCSLLPFSFFPLLFHLASADFSPFGFFQDLQGSKKGDNGEGISRVRAYLQRFGYISSTHPTTETDDHFDEALESAIKKFQGFYNLEPIGILDAPATNDIISSHTHGHNHSHLKIGPQFVFFPGTPRWPSGERHLIYLLNITAHLEALYAVKSALGAWAAVSSFNFNRTYNPNIAKLSIAFRSRADGAENPFDGPGGVIGQAEAPTKGKMLLDGDEPWMLGVVPGLFDLLTACTHEIGHLLGLAHTLVKEAIMFAYAGLERERA